MRLRNGKRISAKRLSKQTSAKRLGQRRGRRLLLRFCEMEHTAQIAGQQPIISTAGVDVDRLEQWYKEYMAVNDDDMDDESSINLDADSDCIDVESTESQVQPVLSTAGVDVDHLEQWHEDYMAVNGDDLDDESSISLDADSDCIDVETTESQVQPVLSTAGVEFDRLEQWYKDYMAVDGNDLGLESSIILDLNSDRIDFGDIESQVRQVMSTRHISRGFCHDCQHQLSHWPDLIKDCAQSVGRPFRTEELEAGTRSGCKFCSFLLSRLKEAGLLDTFRRIEKRLFLCNDAATASVSIFNLESDVTQKLWLNFPGKVSNDFGIILDHSSHVYLTSFSTQVVPLSANCYEDSIDRFEIASEWLHTCSEHHDDCRSNSEFERPTRLVSIANDIVKLVLTANLKTLPQYATLSYCWGCEEFTKLTSNNLDSFLNIIPHEDLPKTFKDAIYIARRLELEYIWIDALCIIQSSSDTQCPSDDNGDWIMESGRMRSVYGNAHVNIAASSATNVYEGCLSKPTGYIDGFRTRVTMSGFYSVLEFYAPEFYEKSTTKTHLASRAWALQEKLLAPRTIYSGDRGLFWECRSTTRSEFFPGGFAWRQSSSLVLPEGEAWKWLEIVTNYSRAHLTNSADKLPALSGIARRQYEATGDEYLAGMWRKKLTEQLCWCSHSKNRRPEWRAPTWSWTSIDASISFWEFWYRDKPENEYIQVIDATTTLAGSDYFGAVSGGELQLRCTAIVRGYYSGPGNVEADQWSNDRVTLGAETRDVFVDMDCLEDDFINAGNSVFLLPLLGDTDDSAIRGIVLQCGGVTKGQFRRIGSFDFCLEWRDDKRDDYSNFMRAMEEVGAATAESECAAIVSDAEHHPESRYVITII